MIYFVQEVGGGPVKIGCSGRLSERLSQLQGEIGRPLRVLGVTDGGPDREREIHLLWDHVRIGSRYNSEWFRDDADLRDFVSRECRPWDGRDDLPPRTPPQRLAPYDGDKGLGDRVADAREAVSMTQADLARKLGCGPSYVSDVETGRRHPTLDWLWAAAGAIGCDPSKLDDRLAPRRKGSK